MRRFRAIICLSVISEIRTTRDCRLMSSIFGNISDDESRRIQNLEEPLSEPVRELHNDSANLRVKIICEKTELIEPSNRNWKAFWIPESGKFSSNGQIAFRTW